MKTPSPAEGETAPRRPWRAYFEASLGFRNHWYPAFFSRQLAEGECRGQVMLGERILFKRIDGKVYAIEDRCAAPRRAVLGAPGVLHQEHHQLLVSRLHLRRARRQAGRDHHRPGKPADRPGQAQVVSGRGAQEPGVRLHRRRARRMTLALDLQPGFLDDDLAVFPNGEHEIVKSNWRLAAENGVDASHIYIHRNSALINAARRPLPLASYFLTREGMVVDQDGAPKGVVKGAGRRTSVWETEIEGVKIESQYRPGVNTDQRNVDRHLAVAALRPQGRSVPAARHHPVRMVRAARRAVAPLHRHLGQAGEGRARKPSSSSARWTWSGRTSWCTSSTTRT